MATDLNHSFKKIPEQLIFSVFLSLIYVLIFGYQFNSGDQSEHLPQVYQKLDPTLYPNDFFLKLYHQSFTVRFYWVEVVAFFSGFFPVSVVCFVMYILCLSLSMFACIRISELLFQNRWTSLFTVFFVFILFNRFTVGGNQLQGTIFVSSNLAEVFACFGILNFFKDRFNIAALLFALASIFQVLVGFQLWILFSAVLLFSLNQNKFKQLFLFSIIYLFAAAPILFPLVRNQFFVATIFDEQLYYKVVYVYRTILHFKPTLFPITDYVKMLILIIPSIYFLYTLKSVYKRAFVVLFILILFGALVYTFLIDVLNINAIGKIQWFKTMVWLNLFCCLLLADWFVKQTGHFLKHFESLLNPYLLTALSVLILMVVTGGKYLPSEKFKTRYQVGNYKQTDLQIVHDWVKENTPVDAVFLVSPLDDAFACEAQRSQPVNYKAVVHEPYYFKEWYRTMQEYYHVDFEKLGNNTALAQAENHYQNLIKYPVNNLAQYRIDDVKLCKEISDQLDSVIFRKGDWIVTKIDDKQSKLIW